MMVRLWCLLMVGAVVEQLVLGMVVQVVTALEIIFGIIL